MSTQAVERFSVKEVEVFLKEGKGVLIDTLPAGHYQARHIPGAMNACVYDVTFLDEVAGLVPDKNTPVALYGAGEKSFDSMAAAEKIARAGYEDIAVFVGGLDAWREHRREREGMAPDETDLPQPSLELEPREYRLVPEESIIKWTGRNDNGGHTGILKLSDGNLDATGDPAGEFSIDMTSLKNVNLEGDELQPVLEAHLKSDDFFFTSVFPRADFKTTLIRLVEDGESSRPNTMIQGKLVLRGLSHEIAFPAHIRNVDEGRLAIVANLDFDRTQWGVIYGSSRYFQYLGHHVVYDFVSIDFRLILE